METTLDQTMSVLIATLVSTAGRQRPSNSSAFTTLRDIVHRSISQCALWFTCLPLDLDGVEDFWRYAGEVIDGTHEAYELPKTEQDLVEFLRTIFSDKILAPIIRQLTDTKDSNEFILPPNYFLRTSYGDVAQIILDILRNLAMDECERLADEPQEFNSSSSNNGETDGKLFSPPVAYQIPTFEVVTVPLLERSLGPRHMAATRSEIFARNSLCRPYTSNVWDGMCTQQKCYLYHGTRTVNLANFQTNGIQIKTFKPNELDSVPVFYVVNHMEAAYEHPLVAYHRIFGTDANEPVSVLAFECDSAVLMGLKMVPGEDTMFTYRAIWPRTNEEVKDFHSFCTINRAHGQLIKNMSEADQQRQFIQRPHQYDIVLTPIHIPGPSDLVGNPPNLRGHQGHLFQVGFCSERSRHYAESCLVKIYSSKPGSETSQKTSFELN